MAEKTTERAGPREMSSLNRLFTAALGSERNPLSSEGRGEGEGFGAPVTGHDSFGAI